MPNHYLRTGKFHCTSTLSTCLSCLYTHWWVGVITCCWYTDCCGFHISITIFCSLYVIINIFNDNGVFRRTTWFTFWNPWTYVLCCITLFFGTTKIGWEWKVSLLLLASFPLPSFSLFLLNIILTSLARFIVTVCKYKWNTLINVNMPKLIRNIFFWTTLKIDAKIQLTKSYR